MGRRVSAQTWRAKRSKDKALRTTDFRTIELRVERAPHNTRANDRSESDSVPTQPIEVLEELQVSKKDREELQKSLVITATKHAGIIIAKLRKLHATARITAKKAAPRGGEG